MSDATFEQDRIAVLEAELERQKSEAQRLERRMRLQTIAHQRGISDDLVAIADHGDSEDEVMRRLDRMQTLIQEQTQRAVEARFAQGGRTPHLAGAPVGLDLEHLTRDQVRNQWDQIMTKLARGAKR